MCRNHTIMLKVHDLMDHITSCSEPYTARGCLLDIPHLASFETCYPDDTLEIVMIHLDTGPFPDTEWTF